MLMKRQILLLTALSLVMLFTNCSKSNLKIPIPEPEPVAEITSIIDSCISVLAPNFLPSDNRPYIFHGTFGINPSGDWETAVNCIKNPSNWHFSIHHQSGWTFFKILINYPRIVPEIPGPAYLLLGDDLILTLQEGDCKEFSRFKFAAGSSENHQRAHFLISLPEEYWECYEIGAPFMFDFFVTGTYDFPIYQ